MNSRLNEMIERGRLPLVDGQWIDTYNQITDADCAGTILEGISYRNIYYVMKKIDEPIAVAQRGREPQTLTPKRNAYGKAIRKDSEAGKVKVQRKFTQQLEPRTDGVSNTLTGVQKDNLIAEPIVLGWTRDEKGNVVDRHPVEVANAVTAAKRDNTQNYVEHPNYRIRKLTPRECFRLMGVSERDIDTLLNAGISNSQLYKLAGNSIVVNCLTAIFRQLFIGNFNKHQQTEIF